MTLKARLTMFVTVVGLSLGLAACKSPPPTAPLTTTAPALPTLTEVGASATPVPPTDTLLPPTETALPPTATETPSLPTPIPSVRVLVKLLNVRSGPGTAYPIIAIVKEGDELTALGRTGDNLWIVVGMADGKSGWCSAYNKYVTLDVDVSQLPIAPIPAPPKAAAPTAARTPTP